jgi:hypothetical protein
VKQIVFILGLSLGFPFFIENALAAEPSVEEKIEILQNEIDQLKANSGGAPNSTPAAGATTIGGYGEIEYNKYNNTSEYNNQMDLNRFVILIGHRFTDSLRFFSEVEWEHAVASAMDKGESEIEQAFLEDRFNDAFNLKVGLILVPLGILNETHEPPTYYGVERNFVETLIIPSTWREGGIGFYGEITHGLHYDIGVTTGFDAGKITSSNPTLSDAHQELQLAIVNDLSIYSALNYRCVPGLRLGGGLFTGNTGQNGASNPLLKGVDARLILWDLHGQYSVGKLDLQAVYARGTWGDAARVSAALTASSGVLSPIIMPGSFFGWYGQAAYHVWRKGDIDVAPFIRYEHYNTEEGVGPGFMLNPLNSETVTTAGVNFKIHPQVVFKADYQKFDTDTHKDRFDLGVGYMF